MYATPIAYPMSFLKGKSFANIIQWNPLTSIVESFRYALLGQGELNFAWLGYSAIFTIVVLFFGIVIFNKVEKSFMDTV